MKKFYIEKIKNHLREHLNAKVSKSIKFPYLMPFFVFLRRTKRKIENFCKKIAKKKWEKLNFINVRHQSVLMRKLGDTDIKLQENKVTNLRIAAEKINNIIIYPWETFSFWEIVGKPSYKDGYLDGILIHQGRAKSGVGGGICQMANLIYWMFLHTGARITERHHHSYDLFPDSGRVLPFSSGATVFYNYVDLQIKNTLDYPLQICVWTDEKYLKWQIRSPFPRTEKIHIIEDFHTFIKHKNIFYRYNIISRERKIDEKTTKEQISENFAPVMYNINEEIIAKNWYNFLEISENL